MELNDDLEKLIQENGDEDPVFLKKLKAEITEGKMSGLNPVKQAKLKKAMLYTDIRLDFVLFLRDYLRSPTGSRLRSAGKAEENIMEDILTLIGIISSKGNFGSDKFYKKTNKQSQTDEDEEAVQENYVTFKKHFSELWAEVMKWKMTPSIHRKVVILLPEKVMMHLTKPLHMSDFLLQSFRLGGPVSLVSLHGIFLLMQNFNFEVSDFYSRLYSMFTSETLGSKYRARFFAYSREFLASTHLPENLVASFIKKLSRLSLTAPCASLPMIFDFVTNLIIQHPGLKVLLNPVSSNGQPKIKELVLQETWDCDFELFMKNQDKVLENLKDPDPFDEDEPDPMKTRAIESWLCEIKALQNHAVSSIALKAKFVSKALPKVEKDMDETLSLTYKDIEDEEREMSNKVEPTPSHVKPNATFSSDQIEEDVVVKKSKISNT